MAYKFNVFTGTFDITDSGGSGGINIGDAVGSGTPGSVLFIDASGNLGQDNANFFWDDANNRLGIGTNTPDIELSVVRSQATAYGPDITGELRVGILNMSTADNSFSELGFRANNSAGIIQTTSRVVGIHTNHTNGSVSGEIALVVRNNGTLQEVVRVSSVGYVGIGTNAPTAPLEIQDSFTNPASTHYSEKLVSLPTISTDGTYTIYAFGGSITPSVASGKTASGKISALQYTTVRNLPADAGTVADLRAQWLEIGHNTGLSSSAVTTEAYGQRITQYFKTGTITALYGCRIETSTTGGVVTNSRAFYIDQATGTSETIGFAFLNKKARSGLGVSSPTAVLHLQAGTAAANSAPLKIDKGVVLASTEKGAVETDGTHIYWTDDGGTRRQLDQQTAGSGITRSVNSISGDTTAGSTGATDYVYLVTGTVTLTLPTAVGNTNLYTVKNVGSNTVTIATSGGQTIDGSASALLPVQYTSLDLISDGSNWNVV